MSLRAFHIVFIVVTTLLSAFMALWAYLWAPSDLGSLVTMTGVAGVVGVIGLPLYGVYFYRKARKLIL